MFRLIVVALTALIALTACSAPAVEAPSPSPSPRGEFLWHVIDANGARVRDLPDDDPAVTDVRAVVVLHSGVVDNRSPETVAASVTDEFRFYHPDFADRLREQNYEPALVSLFTDNRLTTRQVAVAWYESTFGPDMTTATARFESTFEFTGAAPEYLAANQFALNSRYTQRRVVSLTRDGAAWRISRIEKDPLTRAVLPGGR